MTRSNYKISQFWQELKRRNVTRVLAVYIAAAFMVLELVDIVSEPFGLPDWSLRVAFFVLLAGFFIAIIISWIYDVTPEGVEKTKPSAELEPGEREVTTNSWKIASYISFVVIIALITINVIPRHNRLKELAILGKSIAVLPFINDSPDEENAYFINGIMEAIIDNLCKIEDLRVVGRTSVEQYRNAPKPVRVIADEMDVSYILEGSGQKYGNKVSLTLQLLDARNDKHLWSNPFSREIVIEDIFTLQSEIAQLVAAEIKAIVTPEEKQLIEKVRITNLTAYDFYQRGREELTKYWLSLRKNKEALERAEDLYRKALEYDSAFALAYTGLADVYFEKNRQKSFFSENYLDSMLILADIALSFDDQLAETYYMRGRYYRNHNEKEQAYNEFDKALKLNPNLYEVYWFRGLLYFSDGDLVKAIDDFQTSATLQRGPDLAFIYQYISAGYGNAGFKEKAIYYETESFILGDDSVNYYEDIGHIEYDYGNFEKAIELVGKAYAIDSTKLRIILELGKCHMWLGQLEESLEYFKKYDKIFKTLNLPYGPQAFRIGYAYQVNGFNEEAQYYFDRGFEFIDKLIELGRPVPNYILAAIYAFLGDKEKAYENLRLSNRRQIMLLVMVTTVKNDPLLDSIRDEPEFQQLRPRHRSQIPSRA